MAYLDENVFVRAAGIPGDADGDGEVSIADITTILDYMLSGKPINERQADVDNDGSINIGDIVMLVDIILNK